METRVKVDLSFTRNLGNYESIKIGVGIEDWVRDGETAEGIVTGKQIGRAHV